VLQEKHGLKVFESGVRGEVFGCKEIEVNRKLKEVN